MELIFLNLFHMRDTHNDFQLPSTKTEIVVKLGQFNPPETLPWGRGDRGREVKFPRSPSYPRHTYQFSASYLQDCDLTYNRSQMGALLPPWTPLGGGWGWGVKFPRSTSYEKHKY